MIDQRFMDSLYGDMALPPSDLDQAQQEGVLLAENKNVSYPNEVMTDTGGGAMVGYRLNMPKGLVTQEQAMTRAKELPRAVAATAKGAAQGSVGMYGDLEGLTRSLINLAGGKVDEDTLLPTTEKVKEFLDQYIPMGKENAPYEATGEVISPAGVVGLGMKAAKPAMRVLKESVDLAKTLPMGLSIKSVGEGVDTLGFYSAASKAVDSIAQEKGTGAQFLAQIQKTPGVKQEELLWTGLDDFLKGKKSVTKAEVQDYLNSNRVEVKEVKLGSDNPYPYRTADEWQGAIDKAEKAKNFNEAEKLTSAWEDFELGGAGKTKFSKYTLPGGENYREVLLTMPSNMSEYNKFSDSLRAKYGDGGFDNLPMTDIERSRLNKFYADEEKQPFKSNHFDQPNVLAHLRVNDRVDADGKKVLFVEEVQSDWHQAGRKKGYAEDVNKQLESINEQRSALMDEKLRYEKLAEPYTSQGKDAPAEIVDGWTMAANKLNELQTKQNRLGQGVPDAPFKTTWHELAMKRAIQMATEGGYDRIAFTTGKTQAERYDLSKQISRVTYKDEILRAYDKDGVQVISQLTKPENLDEYVGKDLASKIIADNDQLRVANKAYRDGFKNDVSDTELTKLSQEVGKYPMEYKGIDLQVGGEGMKGFYDQILPKFLDKYGKKWDAKTGMTEIPTSNVNIENQIIFEDGKYLVDAGDGINYNSYNTKAEAIKSLGGDNPSVHYMDITPKMKESVLTKGQPMFQVAPAIPAGVAATQQEEKK